MKKWKVFINEVCDVTEKTHRVLEEAGCEIILGRDMYQFSSKPYTEDELAEIASEVDALMGASRDPYTKKVMSNAQNLKVIAKYGIGVENVDLKVAEELGITVTNTPVPENYNAVAEYVVGMMLALAKRLVFLNNYTKGGGWRNSNTYTPLLVGKRVGIIGLGRIGSRICNLLKNWDMDIVGYDPYLTKEKADEIGVTLVDLDVLFTTSDVVIVQAVLTDETRHMINSASLKLMKKTAYLINASRGGLVDEKALHTALLEGWIAGAGLDVFNPEPPSLTSPLLKLDNLIVTPHNAGWSDEINFAICLAATKDCLNVLRGERPVYRVV